MHAPAAVSNLKFRQRGHAPAPSPRHIPQGDAYAVATVRASKHPFGETARTSSAVVHALGSRGQMSRGGKKASPRQKRENPGTNLPPLQMGTSDGFRLQRFIQNHDKCGRRPVCAKTTKLAPGSARQSSRQTTPRRELRVRICVWTYG